MVFVFDLTTLILSCCLQNVTPSDNTWIMVGRIWLGFILDAVEASWEVYHSPIIDSSFIAYVIFIVVIIAELLYFTIMCLEDHTSKDLSRKEITACCFKLFSLINSAIIYYYIVFPLPINKEHFDIMYTLLAIDSLMNIIELIIVPFCRNNIIMRTRIHKTKDIRV